MIIDTLENAEYYYLLNQSFEAAFAFLKRPDTASLPDGRHTIDGDTVYATIFRGRGKGRAQARLESHQRYIDIQYILSGSDDIGLKSRRACRFPIGQYDADKDILFYSDMAESRVTLGPGAFIILYPEDAHAPLSGTEDVAKIVVKVLAPR